jgi:hypothetical protein
MKDIDSTLLEAEHKKHELELVKIKQASDEAAKRQLTAERELLAQQTASDLELHKKRLEMEANSVRKREAQQQEFLMQSLKDDAENTKENNKKLLEQVTGLTKELRAERQAKANVELEAQKKLAEEEGKIREDALKSADEKQRLNLAAKDKTITDLQKALDDAQRKAAQGSQQLQGEIMELDFEIGLATAFRDDLIEPVAKGVKGGDITQTVRSPRGTGCGVILWEIKRTKNWTDNWVPKLKEDVRSSRANIAVIITETMPKQINEEIGQVEGVWVCKPSHAIILGTLLRKSLLEVGYQKAISENRGGKAEALYGFVTSHEFIQQVEAMVETYQEMSIQVQKERVVYEKLWAQREKQAQRLLLGTANIIGSMQEYVGQASMPKIKGLELLDSGDEL